MNTKEISLLKRLAYSLVGAIFVLFTMFACDKLESDSIPRALEKGKVNKIYVQSNGSVLFDMNALAEANKNFSFLVSTNTKQGTLSDFGSGLFEYKTKSANSSQDGFGIKVMDGDKVVKNDSIILIIEDDTAN